MAEEFIQSSGGKIFVRSWKAPGTPRALVILCHGFNSHSGQYQWAGEQLAAAGYAVYALDLRGRGRSDGKRFYTDKLGAYASDVAAAINHAKSHEPGLKTFLLGHSAGGVTSCVYTLDHQSEIDGLICESFAYKVPAPAFALQVIKFLSLFLPNLGVLKLPNKAFSRDPKVVAALEADPLTKNENQPAITVANMVRANERLKREFPRITLPVLILHGSEDHATMTAGSQEFYDHAGSKDKTLKIYPGHFHDLLADIGKEGVLGDIKAWIDAHLTS